MLYATTRSDTETVAVRRTLTESRSADGGFYLPYRLPKLNEEGLSGLLEMSFNACVAQILNLLFGTQLSAWDVDFAVGRYPVRLEKAGHRILIAESWHNPQWSYEYTVSRLISLLDSQILQPNDWTVIAVRIAVLFGIWGKLHRSGIEKADLAVVSGDFSAPISGWYAREMGLPVGNIICCCNENNQIWELLCHGQMRTDALSIPTVVPEADITLPEDLERLIHGCGGTEAVKPYLEAVRQGSVYSPNETMLSKLRNGMYASVVSTGRIKRAVSGVHDTHHYLMSCHTSLAYCGLMDYRAKTGQTGAAVILSEVSSYQDAANLSRILGLSEEQLKNKL